MRATKPFVAGIFVMVTIAAVIVGARALQGGGSTHTVTKADVARWKTELSNWGRWGKDDELGTLNLITPAKRKQAIALVKEGFPVSLGLDVPMEKNDIDNPTPMELKMQGIGSDQLVLNYHGIAQTHLDALAHRFEDGKGYNGYTPNEAVVLKEGHSKQSILGVKNGIFTRGILMDIPRLKGVPYLEPSTPIYVEDLEAWEKMAGVKVGAGDAMIIRTGRWVRRAKMGPLNVRLGNGQAPGLHPSVMPWLKKRDIAVLGSEGQPAVSPSDTPGVAHDFPMWTMGVYILDNTQTDALSEACAARKRWEFLLTIEPLTIKGGTGSPVNPIAMF